MQVDPYSTELRDQTQAGVMAGEPFATGFAATRQLGADDAVARLAAGSFVGPSRRLAVATDLEQLGDPTRGGVLGSVVFAEGPSRYGYARQEPTTKVDKSGLYATPAPPWPSSPVQNRGVRVCFAEWVLIMVTPGSSMSICTYRHYTGAYKQTVALGACPSQP